MLITLTLKSLTTIGLRIAKFPLFWECSELNILLKWTIFNQLWGFFQYLSYYFADFFSTFLFKKARDWANNAPVARAGPQPPTQLS